MDNDSRRRRCFLGLAPVAGSRQDGQKKLVAPQASVPIRARWEALLYGARLITGLKPVESHAVYVGAQSTDLLKKKTFFRRL